MSIIDRFGNCSKSYRSIRPYYPRSLILFLKKTFKDASDILDCGTGNGQFAVELSKKFKNIIAIDNQANQLMFSIKKSNIKYLLMSADNLDLKNNSIDLITCASSLHWFQLDNFYTECRRVMKENSGIAAWSYSWPTTKNRIISKKLEDLFNKIEPYLPFQTKLHINMYKTIEFPFKKIDTPKFVIKIRWTCEQLCLFLMTWASILEYIDYHDANLIIDFKKSLLEQISESENIQFEFPISMICGRI